MTPELLEQFLKIDYPRHIYPDRCTDGSFCYVAEHRDLPGCAAHGDTIEEARAALASARVAYITQILGEGGIPPLPNNQEPRQLAWRFSEEPESEPRVTGGFVAA